MCDRYAWREFLEKHTKILRSPKIFFHLAFSCCGNFTRKFLFDFDQFINFQRMTLNIN